MSAARRLLILGGIGLALLGMIYGVWYAVSAEHQEIDEMSKSLATGFSAAAARNTGAAQSALQQYREVKYKYDRHVDVHGHWIGLAMILVVLGIGLDRVGFNEQIKMLLGAGLVLGSFLFPLGVLLQTFSHSPATQAVAVAGSALVIATLAGMILGFALPQKND
jgi:hypothetical protein